jgi:hypothetical protein
VGDVIDGFCRFTVTVAVSSDTSLQVVPTTSQSAARMMVDPVTPRTSSVVLAVPATTSTVFWSRGVAFSPTMKRTFEAVLVAVTVTGDVMTVSPLLGTVIVGVVPGAPPAMAGNGSRTAAAVAPLSKMDTRRTRVELRKDIKPP